MIKHSAAVAVIFGLTFGSMVGAQSASAPADDHPTLPAGPGRDLMIRVCSQCHLPEAAAEQQLDPAGWKALVDQMASKGADATDPEFETIVRYLSTAFPPPK